MQKKRGKDAWGTATQDSFFFVFVLSLYPTSLCLTLNKKGMLIYWFIILSLNESQEFSAQLFEESTLIPIS